jgi:hypothetical protein
MRSFHSAPMDRRAVLAPPPIYPPPVSNDSVIANAGDCDEHPSSNAGRL